MPEQEYVPGHIDIGGGVMSDTTFTGQDVPRPALLFGRMSERASQHGSALVV